MMDPNAPPVSQTQGSPKTKYLLREIVRLVLLESAIFFPKIVTDGLTQCIQSESHAE